MPTVLPYGAPGAVAGPVFASFGQRLLAWLLDWVILGGVRLALATVLGLVANAIVATGMETEAVQVGGGLVVFASMYLCGWAYYAFFEASSAQATPGKRVVGIRVEDVEGGRATLVQTSVRFFCRLFSVLSFGFGFLMVAFTRRRQALHDIAANCILTVRPPAPVQYPPRPF